MPLPSEYAHRQVDTDLSRLFEIVSPFGRDRITATCRERFECGCVDQVIAMRSRKLVVRDSINYHPWPVRSSSSVKMSSYPKSF